MDHLTDLLTCLVCGDMLKDPITLSCGYTICSTCFHMNQNSLVKKSIFKCPVPQCESKTHLFGPELLADHTITLLTTQYRSCSRPPSPSDDMDPVPSMDYLAPALTCKLCKHTMMDPITSPCGHTFCRICVLKEKIVSDQCTTCYRPLPKYNTLLTQPTHHIISRLVSNCRPIYPLDNPVQIPLFVSGTVILPGQKCRLPIFAPTHIRMFHQSLIMTENGLCLASVHRSRPQVAQFGTLLQIVNIEHRPDALLIDVLGLDRFKLSTHQQQEDSEEYHLLIADFELLKESNLPHASTLKGNELTASYSVELADTILQFIHHLSQSSTQPANSIHTYTHGLLGPLWYESRVTLHGPMPSKYDPAAVCWWAAVILPISASDLYLLLRTIPIIDRLEWVIQWMQQMESQWERCRSTAIHALSQIPQANH